MTTITTPQDLKFQALRRAITNLKTSSLTDLSANTSAAVKAFEETFGPDRPAAKIDTFGLTPMKGYWKLFYIGDWQMLVTLEEGEDDEDGINLVYSIAVQEVGAVQSMKISMGPDVNDAALEAIMAIFDKVDQEQAERALATLLKAVEGPIKSIISDEVDTETIVAPLVGLGDDEDEEEG